MARRRKFNPQPVLRRRQLQRRTVLILLVLLGLGVIADRLGLLRYHGNDHKVFDQQPAMVTRVVDGDTVRIRRGPADDEVPVRLLGIDAPEMNYRSSDPPEYFAEQATNYLRSRVDQRSVILKLEPLKTRDQYNRLLAYLYLNETENVNLAMVRDGYAYADRRFPHTFRSQFEQAEHEARRARRGLWKDVTVEQMPAWRQRWLADRASDN